MSDRETAPTTERRKHSIAHRAEYLVVRLLEKGISALSENASDSLGRRIGKLVYVLGIRRDTVESNLRLAFPEHDDAWIAQTAKNTYEHLGREVAAMMRLSGYDAQMVIDRTVPVGLSDVQDALSLGNGVILVTGHYGNWEMAAATIASRGYEIGAIVRRQGNRMVDERLQSLRRNLGVETIYQGQAPARVPRLLRANGIVGIVGDQDARRSGVFVPFFGRDASTHRGPALFALRLGAPVFFCIARRVPGDGLRYEVTGKRVDFTPSGFLDADVHNLTAKIAACLEAEVRKAPEQYFWFHKRWKTPPPG